MTGAATRRGPSGVSKRAAPSAIRSSASGCESATPAASRRRSQARSSGEAFIPTGKTRPELPTKVATPRPSAQADDLVGAEVRENRPQPVAAGGVGGGEGIGVLGLGRG